MDNVLESVKDLDRINTVLIEEISDLEGKLAQIAASSSPEDREVFYVITK